MLCTSSPFLCRLAKAAVKGTRATCLIQAKGCTTLEKECIMTKEESRGCLRQAKDPAHSMERVCRVSILMLAGACIPVEMELAKGLGRPQRAAQAKAWAVQDRQFLSSPKEAKA
mmetsp:Transcript_44338/g.99982  ORF Transcript_44338/g.99982 Transcript_44338/m.99982 type:complete len:114 (-) Transcript_44338:1354-1695(-)